MQAPLLLPCPQHLQLRGGVCRLPKVIAVKAGERVDKNQVVQWTQRLDGAISGLRFTPGSRTSSQAGNGSVALHQQRIKSSSGHTKSSEAYELVIDQTGISLAFEKPAGALAGVATLCQLLRQYGRNLPCLKIRDWPDFERRGVMLDVSRGRVPKLETLMQLATDLAGLKFNELQLYMEHTFAYGRHPKVWRKWGALTGGEIKKLDKHCRSLGIDLVPNQNSFGHLRHWLDHKPYQTLAEVSEPYPSADGSFLRYPSTLAPNHPGTIPFLCGLYDELLPNFSSRHFNVGCDETWDLGRGRSKALCQRRGQGRVYLDYLKKIRAEVKKRGRIMMFWGDIILNHPKLIKSLPKDVIALNWGYEAGHPFDREGRIFARSRIPFYVCPGTSTWQTMIGRNDNAFANLEAAAHIGKRHGAIGYLVTDWGDGGHPQPLAVSYPAFLAGAALAWSARTYDPDLLAPVLDREVFADARGRAGAGVLRLGVAHRKFGHFEPNATPFGATLAAPPSEQRELFCRNGLKYYAHLSAADIRGAWKEVSQARIQLKQSRSTTKRGQNLSWELDMAAQMAGESCRYLLWQKAMADNQKKQARLIGKKGVQQLQQIKRDFTQYWPTRNKATPAKCAAFLDWRIQDYQQSRLHYPPQNSALS